MLPPNAPPNNNTSLVPAATQHNIVNWFYLSFLSNLLSIYVYSFVQTRSYIIASFHFNHDRPKNFSKPVNLLFNAVIVVRFIILNLTLFCRTKFSLLFFSLLMFLIILFHSVGGGKCYGKICHKKCTSCTELEYSAHYLPLFCLALMRISYHLFWCGTCCYCEWFSSCFREIKKGDRSRS
jgi:hypothetical protein